MKSGSLGELKGALENENFDDYGKSLRREVDLYKQTALSAWHESVPSEKEAQGKDIAFFRNELKKTLDAEIDDFSKENFSGPDDRFHMRVGALSTFMYLHDKVVELQAVVLAKDKAGLFALFDTVRNRFFDLLSKNFFGRDFSESMADYLALEPLLIACAELAEVGLIPIQDAVKEYQPRLAKLVVERMKGGKADDGPAQEKTAKAGKKPRKKK